MKSFGTSPVPDFFATREKTVDTGPYFLHQFLSIKCPRCGLPLSIEEDPLFGGSGTIFRIACAESFSDGSRRHGEHHWDISETSARRLATLALCGAAARDELIKRVKQITKGKTFGEELDARIKAGL